MNKTAREYKKGLVELTSAIIVFENEIEQIMKLPQNPERGKLIAGALNKLTISNQIALHQVLDYSFKKIGKLYGLTS